MWSKKWSNEFMANGAKHEAINGERYRAWSKIWSNKRRKMSCMEQNMKQKNEEKYGKDVQQDLWKIEKIWNKIWSKILWKTWGKIWVRHRASCATRYNIWNKIRGKTYRIISSKSEQTRFRKRSTPYHRVHSFHQICHCSRPQYHK